MSLEIERKFLLRENGVAYFTPEFFKYFPSLSELKEEVLKSGVQIRQGYLDLALGKELGNLAGIECDFTPVEARLRDKNGQLYFTLKSSGELTRGELDVNVDQRLFESYWPRTEGKRVLKVRLKKMINGYAYEIDEYTDRDLAVAEVETASVEAANLVVPIGLDVTNDKRYKNKNLAK